MEKEKVKDVLDLIKEKEEEVQNEILNAEESAKRELQKRLEDLRSQLERERESLEKWIDHALKERRTEIHLKSQKLAEEHQKQLQAYKHKLLENVERAVEFALKSFTKE